MLVWCATYMSSCIFNADKRVLLLDSYISKQDWVESRLTWDYTSKSILEIYTFCILYQIKSLDILIIFYCPLSESWRRKSRTSRPIYPLIRPQPNRLINLPFSLQSRVRPRPNHHKHLPYLPNQQIYLQSQPCPHRFLPSHQLWHQLSSHLQHHMDRKCKWFNVIHFNLLSSTHPTWCNLPQYHYSWCEQDSFTYLWGNSATIFIFSHVSRVSCKE